MKTIKFADHLPEDIVVSRGALSSVNEYFDLNRRVLVLTDRNIPAIYVDNVCMKCLYPVRVSVWPGKDINSFENYTRLCNVMIENDFTDRDAVVAVGGEKVLALGNFLSSTFKGGMDLYTIPTTLKAQTGKGYMGKSYIGFDKTQNALGISRLPKRTLVDTDALCSLEQRQIANGYAEILRLALMFDKKLFEFIEEDDLTRDKSVDFMVARALEIRKYIYLNVNENPTLGEAAKFGSVIASSMLKTEFSSGERLAVGMLPLCSPLVRQRLRDLFPKLSLPVVWKYDEEKLFRDSVKGVSSDKIALIRCEEIGTYKTDIVTVPEYYKMIKTAFGG